MKYEIDLNGKFVADINFWNGKCKLKYEGTELCEDGKNTFLLGMEKIEIRGTLFSGVTLIRGDLKALIIKLKWYDYIIGLLPFIVSLIGSFIGALIGAVGAFICYKLMPYLKNFALRALVCVAVASLVFLIVLLLASIFPHLFFL